MLAIVGDAIHHVAAAEALRIFQRAHVHAGPGLKVDQFEHDRGRAEVYGQAEEVAAVVVDMLIGVEDRVAVPGHDGVDRNRRCGGGSQDPGRAVERCKFDIDIGIFDPGLAGEAELVAQKIFRLGWRVERFGTVFDFDDALVALRPLSLGASHIPFHSRLLVGDFKQLEPVLDVWKGDYKGSSALHHLCDGNRLQLSHCRRSDRTLFDLYMSADDVDPAQFPVSEVTQLNVAYTHSTRKRVNAKCMREFSQEAEESRVIPANPKDHKSQDMTLFVGVCWKTKKEKRSEEHRRER